MMSRLDHLGNKLAPNSVETRISVLYIPGEDPEHRQSVTTWHQVLQATCQNL